jgi:hypothetical protein
VGKGGAFFFSGVVVGDSAKEGRGLEERGRVVDIRQQVARFILEGI